MYICQALGVAASANRRRNPRGEGARLREQLLQATTELLDEVGDAGHVSVRAIARRAGVSPTALYLQFPDRDALVAAAVDAGFEAFNAALMEAAAGPQHPRDRLEAMGLAYLAFSERQPALYAILFSARRPVLETPLSDRERAFDGLVALLRQVDASLDADAARELAMLVWSSLHGYAMLRAVRPQLEWPDSESFIRRLLTAHHL
jgi:AcrR family transcriptional regulator